MDFIFEDEADEVGSDVEAYCPKCRADTTHVVISKYEDEIRRVQCNPCGDVHSFRKPRGEVEDDVPEPVAAKKRATHKKLTWPEYHSKYGQRNARPYEFRELFRENQVVTHPKFGVGYVSEVTSDKTKVEITFQDARRTLVHGRKDLLGSPLAAEGDGQPTPPPAATKATQKGKAAEADKKKAPAAPAAKVDKPVEKPGVPAPVVIKAPPPVVKAAPVAKPEPPKVEKPVEKAASAKTEKQAAKPAAAKAVAPKKAAPAKPAPAKAAVKAKPATKPAAKAKKK